MSSQILSLREPLAAYAAQQAEARGFVDASACVEHLIEADRREALPARIYQALSEGLESEAVEVTADWWAKKRDLIASVTPESAS